jgi:hypothetical protein
VNASNFQSVVNVRSGFIDYNTPGEIKFCRGINFNAKAGQIVRVAICRGASLSSFNDIELKISGPNGYIGASASFDNNFEIMEFMAPASGTYYAAGCFKSGGNYRWMPEFSWAYYLQ